MNDSIELDKGRFQLLVSMIATQPESKVILSAFPDVTAERLKELFDEILHEKLSIQTAQGILDQFGGPLGLHLRGISEDQRLLLVKERVTAIKEDMRRRREEWRNQAVKQKLWRRFFKNFRIPKILRRVT